MTELKQIDGIESLIERYGLGTLVETGCYQGDGMEQAIRLGLRSLYSCDINEHWVEHCRQRFPGAHLWQGPSANVLAEMCVQSDGPTLFWLDAHLPEMYGVKAKGLDMPVLDELEIIRHYKRHFERDVVIIDDTRILKSDDNPRFQPDETICCEPIEGISIADIVGKLSRTHMANHHHDGEGYIVFTPAGKYVK